MCQITYQESYRVCVLVLHDWCLKCQPLSPKCGFSVLSIVRGFGLIVVEEKIEMVLLICMCSSFDALSLLHPNPGSQTPRDKVQCVLRTCSTIMNLLSLASEGNVPGADDFVPVLVYILIKVILSFSILPS